MAPAVWSVYFIGSDTPIFSVTQRSSDSFSPPRGAVIPCVPEGNSPAGSPSLRPLTDVTPWRSPCAQHQCPPPTPRLPSTGAPCGRTAPTASPSAALPSRFRGPLTSPSTSRPERRAGTSPPTSPAPSTRRSGRAVSAAALSSTASGPASTSPRACSEESAGLQRRGRGGTCLPRSIPRGSSRDALVPGGGAAPDL